MKIKGMSGEFAFKALVSFPRHEPECWNLSLQYFFTYEDALKASCGANIKWPVEVFEDGSVYIPSEDELQ